MTLWKYIKEKMLEHPTQTVNENDAAMTFEELCIFAESYAKKLTADYYGILCSSELATAMALLSCMAAGKPAVIMPTRYGRETYERIWDRADPPCIITDTSGGLSIIPVSSSDRPKTPEKDIAIILYTSGSTGEPKGVMLSNSNIICNIKDIRSYFPVTTKDTILISRPLYHSSVLTGEFLASLCAGARIVFTSEPFQPLNIINLLKETKATVYGNTPTLIATMSRFIRKPRELSVRLLSVSGECMTEGMARAIRKAFPNADIFCGYGMSEASPRIAYLPAEDFDEDPTCAGVALPSVKIRIVRSDGNDAAKGESGEILVKGDNVMVGYFDDKKRTEAVKRHGWLHTGDIGYFDKRSWLYIKGRKDDMIIRAGMNIYPAELESRLSDDTRVKDILVYGYEKGGTQEIGMYISGTFVTVGEVFDLCRKRLPAYQLPSRIEILDELPKNKSGKLRRRIS